MRKVLALTVAVLALSGCGSEDSTTQDQPGVATLQSAAPQSTPSGNVDDQRPLLRIDMSPEEAEALWAPHLKCLRDGGVPGIDVGGGRWKPTEEEGQGPHNAVYTACRPKEPELEIDRLKRNDYSEYMDRYHAFLKCMRDADVDVSPDGDGPRIKFNKEGDALNRRIGEIGNRCSETTKF
jgi:uncharacterized protein YceK